jgi:hypothetical protein
MSSTPQQSPTDANNFENSSGFGESVNKSQIRNPSVSINICNSEEPRSQSSLNHSNNISSNKVRLKDLRRTYFESAKFSNPLTNSSSLGLSISESDIYSKEEALRMSEEKLLAELQGEVSQDEDYPQAFHKAENSYEHSIDSEDEDDKEAHDTFPESNDTVPLKYPGRVSPIIGRRSYLPLGGSNTVQPTSGFNRKGNMANTSSIWMSMSNDDTGHECVQKCSSQLHLAVKSGNVDAMELLLETMADPNVKDCMGRTPLHWAVCAGIVSVVLFI